MKNIIALLILSCFLVAQDHKTSFYKSSWHYEDGEEYFFETKKGKIGTLKLNIRHLHYRAVEDLGNYSNVYVSQGNTKMPKKTYFRAYSMYDNGQIKEEGLMFVWKSSSEKTGKWEGWYENGQKKYSGSYLDTNPIQSITVKGTESIYHEGGTKVGEWKTWYPNGQLRSVGHYPSEELFQYRTGILHEVNDFSNDIPLGKWDSYYSNGQKKSRGVYQLVISECNYATGSDQDIERDIKNGLIDFSVSFRWDDWKNADKPKTNNEYIKLVNTRYDGVAPLVRGDYDMPYSACASIKKAGRWFEWYESGWGKEYSVDGVVKSSHKESEQAFLDGEWEPEKDKNYQAAYALAQKAFLNAVDWDGDPVGREKDFVEFKSKSKRDKYTYKQFVFTGDLKVMTYRKTTRVRETDPYILEALDAGVGQNYGFSYYKNKTQTYGVGGTGERTYFIECDDGECSIVDEESQY